MKLSAVAAFAALGAAMSGCATIMHGTTQTLTVNTAPEQGAQCTLINTEGTWFVRTPGTVVVQKTKSDMDVTCNKKGYTPGHAIALSHFKMTTAANVVLGGVIVGAVGVGIDAASGADYYYDNPLYVALGTNLATGEPSSPFAASLHCSSPDLTGMMTLAGPDGSVTATVVFDINSAKDANAVHVTPEQEGVCTVSALEGIIIRSASFEIGSFSAADGQPLTSHVDIEEVPADRAHGVPYSFHITAKDKTESQLTLKFPLSYR